MAAAAFAHIRSYAVNLLSVNVGRNTTFVFSGAGPASLLRDHRAHDDLRLCRGLCPQCYRGAGGHDRGRHAPPGERQRVLASFFIGRDLDGQRRDVFLAVLADRSRRSAGPGERAERKAGLGLCATRGTRGSTAGLEAIVLDYLYLGFSTATAFSPTDGLPLTRRATMPMMIESAISLWTLVIVLSRAINVIPS
jgi:hypothetical protein